MSDELEQLIEETDRELGGGGGGAISYVEIMFGWKVFAAAPEWGGNVFPFRPGKQYAEERSRAFQEAKTFADSVGAAFCEHEPKCRRCGITIRRHRDRSYKGGELVTWSVPTLDEYEHFWTPASVQLVRPSLKEAGITKLPWSGWVRLAWADDPDGYMEEDRRPGHEGEMRVKQIAYVSEVFTEAEAMALVEEMAAKTSIPGFEDTAPSGKSTEGLPLPTAFANEQMEESFRKAVVGLIKEDALPEKIAKDIGGGVTVQQIAEWATFYRMVKETADLGLPLAATKLRVTEDMVTLWRGLV